MNKPLNEHSLKELAGFLFSDKSDTPLDRLPTPIDTRLPTLVTKRRELSEVSRTKYAGFFDGLDAFLAAPDAPEEAESMAAAREHGAISHAHATAAERLKTIATTRSREAANMLREQSGIRAMAISDGAKARARLQELKPREWMLVTEPLIRNIQSACSYYNKQDNGKRFKTRRAPMDESLLQIARIK